MEVKKHSLKYNYILSVAINMASYIFPLITYPYVTRILGAEGIGKVSFAETAASYFVLFTTLGIPTYGIRACAAVRDNKRELAKVTKELLTISLIMMIISLTCFVTLIFFLPQFAQRKELLLINCITIILTPFGVNWFFNAIEDFTYITIRTLMIKVVTLTATFLFVRDIKDYNLYALVLVLSTGGSYIYNFVYMNRFVDLRNVKKLELRRHMKPVLILFATTAAATVYSNVDVTMLGLISGDVQVGIYNVAHKLRQVILSLVSTVGTVLIPRMSYYIKNNKTEEFNRLVAKSIQFICLSAVSLMLFFFTVARESVLLIAGSGYEDAILVFICILPTIVFCAFSNMTGLQILVPMEKENILLKSLIIGAVMDVLLNALLIVKWKAVGVAIATAIAELAVLMYQLWYLHKCKLICVKGVNIYKTIIFNLIAFLVTFIFGFFLNHMNVFVTFLLKAVMFWSIYGVLLIIFRDEFVISIIEPILNKVRGR